MRGLSVVVASGGHSSSQCAGLSPSRPLLLWSTGSRRTGSAIVAHGPRCSAACGIFPDQGSNLGALHWQADSQPLRHQGSPPISDIGFYSLLEYKLQMLLWLNLTHAPGCQDSVKALTRSSCCLLSTLGFWYKQTKKGLKKRDFKKPNCLKCGALESWCKRWGK